MWIVYNVCGLAGGNNQKLLGDGVIRSLKQLAGSKGKTSFYFTVNILIRFNCSNVK